MVHFTAVATLGAAGVFGIIHHHANRPEYCQRPSKAAQVWPSKIAHLAEVTSL